MRALLHLCHGIAIDDLLGEGQQLGQLLLVAGQGRGHQELLDAHDHRGQAERALVGAPDDEGLLPDRVDDDARGLEVLGQWLGRVGVGHDQLVDVIEALDGRHERDGCGVLQVLDADAAGLGQGRGAVLDQHHVVAELAPAGDLPSAMASPLLKYSGNGAPSAGPRP